MSLLEALKKAFIDWIASELNGRLVTPLAPKVIITKQEVLTVLKYAVTLPAVTAPDVASWNIGTVVNGAAETVAPIVDQGEVEFNAGDQVTIRVQEVDTAGNLSGWSPVLSFTASDTLPPPAPGAPTVVEVA